MNWSSLLPPRLWRPTSTRVGGDRAVDAGRRPNPPAGRVRRPGQQVAALGRAPQLVDEVGGVPTALVEVVERRPGRSRSAGRGGCSGRGSRRGRGTGAASRRSSTWSAEIVVPSSRCTGPVASRRFLSATTSSARTPSTLVPVAAFHIRVASLACEGNCGDAPRLRHSTLGCRKPQRPAKSPRERHRARRAPGSC